MLTAIIASICGWGECNLVGQESSQASSNSTDSTPNIASPADDPQRMYLQLPEGMTSLPLPEHPQRRSESIESSRPPEAQPNRDSRAAVSRRTDGTRMPIPGRPSKRLPPLSELDTSHRDVPTDRESWMERRKLLDGIPHSFRDGGLQIESIYTGESFTKAHGGASPGNATNYRSNLDLVCIVNTSRMNWWDHGRFFVCGQNLSGRPLSQNEVGDTLLFSNLDSTISATERPTFTTIAEYWYEHLFADGRLRCKVGKQDANVEFALSNFAGDFVNAAFEFPAMIPLPTFPSQALGISTFLQLHDTCTFGLGVFDGSLPSGPQGVRWGFDTLGHHGAFSIYQLEWQPAWKEYQPDGTTLRVGMWHHSDSTVWTPITTDPNLIPFAQNYGVFCSLDQMLWRESNPSSDDQGLAMFGQFGWAPEDRNHFTEYYGAGLVYTGLIAGRDHDLLGIGIANGLFSPGVIAQASHNGVSMTSSETATEVFYKYLHSRFFSFQPDLQYIANPSGTYKDALVAGLRFEIVL